MTPPTSPTLAAPNARLRLAKGACFRRMAPASGGRAPAACRFLHLRFLTVVRPFTPKLLIAADLEIP
jgi:hypothetical protein